jgi:hypothetical protein
MKIYSVGAELFHADGRTDRRADEQTDGRMEERRDRIDLTNILFQQFCKRG